MKERLGRSEKKAKNSTEANDMRLRFPDALHGSDSDVCELCEKPGHDMFNCDALPPLRSNTAPGDDPSDLFCEDCDTHGHTTADCPHSMDVF
jgi:CAP-Gly domain-containing linker protein 1